MRLDVFLVQNELCESREKAQLFIKRNCVTVNGKTINRSAFQIDEGDSVKIISIALSYVGIGGEKLEKALKEFNINVDGLNAMDVGASTGGFTDCLLQNGAKIVYAVDIGHGQLHASLIKNKKVINLENTDIRTLTLKKINNKKVDLITADLSFISIENVLQHFDRFLKKKGKVILLIKPQFELKARVNFKKGILKSEKIRNEILDRVKAFILKNKYTILNQTTTTVDNPKQKNIEYLLLLQKL